MKRNILFKIFLLFGLMISLSLPAYAGWLFNKTPAIEGVVQDATTGDPIENVLVSCKWGKTYYVGGLGGPSSKTIGTFGVLTDKEGKYRIPSRISFHILTYLDGIDIALCHPLYETKWDVFNKDWKTKEWEWIKSDNYKNGIIHYDVELLDLGTKYDTPEDNFKLSSKIEGIGSARYFVMLREHNIPFDLNEIFKKWEILINRFPEAKHFDTLNRRFKNSKKKIKRNLKKAEKRKK